MSSDERWQEVRRRVQHAIDLHFDGSTRKVAAAAAMDYRTLDDLLAGGTIKTRPPRVRLSKTLGWAPGTIDLILDGHEPADTSEEVDDTERRLTQIEATLAQQALQLDRLERLVRGDG